MAYLALDKGTGDLILGEDGGVVRVCDGRFIIQQVQSKLRTVLGEWLIDPSIGWLNLEDFEKAYDQSKIERRAREIILSTEGVLSIEYLKVTNIERKVVLTFKAYTIYGNIDLTVPWED